MILLYVPFLFSIGCTSSDLVSYDSQLGQSLVDIGFSLESKDINKLGQVTTLKGFENIMILTDSLNKSSLVDQLSADLKKLNVFSVDTTQEGTVVCSLGEADEILGASNGYIFLKVEKGSYKMDLYRAGK